MFKERLAIVWKVAEVSALVFLFLLILDPNDICKTSGTITECAPLDMNLCLDRIDGGVTVPFCPYQMMWLMKCLILVEALLAFLFLLMKHWEMEPNALALAFAQPIISTCIYLLLRYLKIDWRIYWKRSVEVQDVSDIFDHDQLNSTIRTLASLQFLFFCYSFWKLLKDTWPK